MSRVGAQSPGNAAGDSELREIHQKMSRKIAQLTKVIYTLNTKNEDSEAKIKHLGNSRKEIIQSSLFNFAYKREKAAKLTREDCTINLFSWFSMTAFICVH